MREAWPNQNRTPKFEVINYLFGNRSSQSGTSLLVYVRKEKSKLKHLASELCKITTLL